MRFENVNPEQSNACFMFEGNVTEQYDLIAYDSIVIASLTKEEYDDGSYMWFAVIDGECIECGDEIDFNEAKVEFFEAVERDLEDKINYNTELLDALGKVSE